MTRSLKLKSASATVRATYGFGHNDDRVFVDDEVQIFAIGDASGPTYGGYHEPIGAEPGWQALRRTWMSLPAGSPTRLRDAIAAANAAMFDPEWPAGSLTHPTASMTVLGFHHGEVAVGQVGTCRAYRLRGASFELLVDDHSLETQCRLAKDPVPEFHRDVATRLLGAAADVEGSFSIEAVQSGDLYLLCTDGLWMAAGDGQLCTQCECLDDLTETAASLLRLLPWEHHGDATVVLLRVA